jgi:hypothetical protein
MVFLLKTSPRPMRIVSKATRRAKLSTRGKFLSESRKPQPLRLRSTASLAFNTRAQARVFGAISSSFQVCMQPQPFRDGSPWAAAERWRRTVSQPRSRVGAHRRDCARGAVGALPRSFEIQRGRSMEIWEPRVASDADPLAPLPPAPPVTAPEPAISFRSMPRASTLVSCGAILASCAYLS